MVAGEDCHGLERLERHKDIIRTGRLEIRWASAQPVIMSNADTQAMSLFKSPPT